MLFRMRNFSETLVQDHSEEGNHDEKTNSLENILRINYFIVQFILLFQVVSCTCCSGSCVAPCPALARELRGYATAAGGVLGTAIAKCRILQLNRSSAFDGFRTTYLGISMQRRRCTTCTGPICMQIIQPARDIRTHSVWFIRDSEGFC